MKNWKKLLLCMAVTAMITSFIGMIAGLSINLIMDNKILKNEEMLEELSISYGNQIKLLENEDTNENIEPENIGIENNINVEDTRSFDEWGEPDENAPLIENFPEKIEEQEVVENNNEQENLINTDEKVSLKAAGKAIFITSYVYPHRIYSLYLISVGIGLVLGVMVYLIFIRQLNIKRLILPFIVCLIAIFFIANAEDLILYGGVSDLSSYLSNELTIILAVAYLIIFVVCYVINLIHQKRVTNKLNEELYQVK